MKRRWLRIAAITMTAFFCSGPAFCWDNVTTHVRMTNEALNYLRDKGYITEDDICRAQIRERLTLGARNEDVPIKRAWFHFLPALDIAITGATCDSAQWAFDNSSCTGWRPDDVWTFRNEFDWGAATRADSYLKPAGWEALGHVLHLLQDLTVPAHVRNDSHAGKILGDPEPLEEYAKSRPWDSIVWETLEEIVPVENPRDFFTVLGDFVRNHYFSADTVYQSGLPGPELDVFSASLRGVDYLWDTAGRKVAWKGPDYELCLRDMDYLCARNRAYNSFGTMHYHNEGCVGWNEITGAVDTCKSEATLDDEIIKEQYEELRRKAVSYSASLIKHYLELGSLTQGLVGHWPLDGSANDVSGNGNHGVVDGATLTADRFGNPNRAMHFASGQHIRVPRAASLEPRYAVSVSVWVKPDRIMAPYPRQFTILSKRLNTSDGWNSYVVDITWAGEPWVLGLPMFYLNSPPACHGASPLTPGVWTHIVGTYDGTALRLYIDGELVDTEQRRGEIIYSDRPLWIGISTIEARHDQFFEGAIDDVRIYNRALSAEEVRSLYRLIE